MQKQTSTQIKQFEVKVQRLEHELKLSKDVTTNQSVDLDKRDTEKDAPSKVRNLKKVIRRKKNWKLVNSRNYMMKWLKFHKPKLWIKKQTEHKCNACDKNFRQSQDLDKHMDARHSEKQCTYCEISVEQKNNQRRELRFII